MSSFRMHWLGAGLTYMTPKATFAKGSVSLAPLHTEGVDYNRLPVIIRYGLGVPIVATERFKWNLEAAYTHVLSDYLDDVSTVYPDRSKLDVFASGSCQTGVLNWEQHLMQPGAQRGNSNRRDGYFVLSVRLIFIARTSYNGIIAGDFTVRLLGAFAVFLS